MGKNHRSTKRWRQPEKERPEAEAWRRAVQSVEDWLCRAPKLEHLFDEGIGEGADGRWRWLVLGVMRQRLRLEAALDRYLRKPPRESLRALLLVAAYEVVEADGERRPRVVHFAVEQARLHLSEAEARLVNAVLRKVAGAWEEVTKRHIIYSHPEWLVGKWEAEFGVENTTKLLEWNQQPAEIYVHVQSDIEVPEGLEPTKWAGFYRISDNAQWPAVRDLICKGAAYIQDPATRHPVALLNPQAGERILDLCASPGGKSWAVWQQMRQKGSLTAVDLPGQRLRRLKENLLTCAGDGLRVVEGDVLELAAAGTALGDELFDGVLVDVPCSNTGVIRRKPDVRWRLQGEDFVKLPQLQLKLLTSAAKWVKPGGRLVYSTCSIGAEENHHVVKQFLQENPVFKLQESCISLPWQSGHDGGGAFLLTRSDAKS